MSWLDPRRVAMLQELGVTVWVRPQPAEVPSPDTADRAEALRVSALDEAALASAAAPMRASPDSSTGDAVRAPQNTPVGEPPTAAAIAQMDWPALREAVAACRACGLCETRRQTVFGVGAQQAAWMVVGEAPGEQEDRQGEPFVGAAGQLLDAMLAAIGVRRDAQPGTPNPLLPQTTADVYIANVLKCRPPGNRNPQPDEIAHCLPYLQRQVALVRPRVILAMGRFAIHTLLNTSEPVGRLRGRVHHLGDTPVVVTYHPAYLLRQPADKGKAWADLCLAAALANGEPLPADALA